MEKYRDQIKEEFSQISSQTPRIQNYPPLEQVQAGFADKPLQKAQGLGDGFELNRDNIVLQELKLNEIFYTIFQLSKCSKIFSEMTSGNDYQCCTICRDIFSDLIQLIQSKTPTISYGTCQVLAHFVYYEPYKNLKAEQQNKKYLLQESFNLFRVVFQQLLACVQEEQYFGQHANALKAFGLLKLLSCFFVQHAESTPAEARKQILEFVSMPVCSTLLTQLMYSRAASISVLATQVTVSLLKMQGEESAKITKELKRQLLDNSTVFLRHMIRILTTTDKNLQRASIEFIHTTSEFNADACDVIKHIFPQGLLRSFDSQIRYSWNLEEWVKFFNYVLRDHDSAIVQWNQESRRELTCALEEEDAQFREKQSQCTRKRKGEEQRAASDKMAEEPVQKYYWNKRDIDVTYPSLDRCFFVNRYYLKNLVDEKKMCFTVQIKQHNDFWNELSFAILEQDSIQFTCQCLKTMVLLQVYSQEEIQPNLQFRFLLGYLNHQKQSLSRFAVPYYVLQLIYTLLNNHSQTLKNLILQSFIKQEGIQFIIS